MYARRSVIVAISFLAFASAVHAAPSARCEAAASPGESSTDAQALQIRLTTSAKATAVKKADTTTLVGQIQHQNDSHALDEMLRGGHATPLRWDRVPELVVLTSVMQYEKGRGTEYRATTQQLTDDEATELVSDLTDALSVLTDEAFPGFSAVRRETVAAGETVNVMRPGQIVVARYNGVRDQLATIGFGGRSTRGSTIRAGSIILDSEFDRVNDTRRLLRMHELGHALGYNHVLSRTSIMNPKIGPEPTDFDRAAARLAFEDFHAAQACS